MSPAAVRAGTITADAIDVDDNAVYGGLTKIGPNFPLGETIGACWTTAAAILRETGGPPLTPPPTDCRPYELTHVLYWDGPLANLRFQGVYAEITAVQGTVALCTIWIWHVAAGERRAGRHVVDRSLGPDADRGGVHRDRRRAGQFAARRAVPRSAHRAEPRAPRSEAATDQWRRRVPDRDLRADRSELTAVSPTTHLSVITDRRDPELERIHRALAQPIEIANRNDLADILGRRLATITGTPAPATLDLIGHAMPGTSLLRLGDWVVDAAQSSVIAFFRELAEHDVLSRLGITALRLIGCVTAGSAHGQYTMCALADVLGVEVYGTTDMICAAHYDAGGFSERYAHALVASAEVRGEVRKFEARADRATRARALDLDALPSEPLPVAFAAAWPLLVVDRAMAADILRMIRRHEGAEMPGLLAEPMCELALPDGDATYVRMQVLLDGEFVRVFPRGVPAGIVYPVADVGGLRRLASAT